MAEGLGSLRRSAALGLLQPAICADAPNNCSEVWGFLTLRDGVSPFWSQAGFSLHAPNQLSNVNLFSLNYLHGWSEQQRIRVLSKCSLMLRNEWLLTLKRSSVAGSYLESCLISHKLSKLIRWGAENIYYPGKITFLLLRKSTVFISIFFVRLPSESLAACRSAP